MVPRTRTMANSRFVRFIKGPVTYASVLVLVGGLLQAAPASSLTFNTRPDVVDEESVAGTDVEGALAAAGEEDAIAEAALDEPLDHAWPGEGAGDTDLAAPGEDLQVVDGLITVAQVSEEDLEDWEKEFAPDFPAAEAAPADDGRAPAPYEPETGEQDEAVEPSPEGSDPEVAPEEELPEVPAEDEDTEADADDEGDEPADEAPLASPVASVRVEVLDRAVAEEAGIDGLLLRVVRTDEAHEAGPVDLTIDYSGFAHAYGGDYGGRLDLTEVDPCLIDESVECQERAPHTFTTDNDAEAQTLTGTVPALGSEGALLAVAADANGSRGDYTATDLSAASSWDVGLQTGDFSWNYPVDTPPVAGDLTPGIELGYSSSSVDGRVSSSNNQASWIGEGFNYASGFIERKYVPCADSQPDNAKTGDLCWSRHNATFSLNGRSGEMFLDEDGTWRMRHDDASKIERLTGATNGDNDGEHWKITTTDGTQYYFGLNRLPGYTSGKPETNSAWTVPVFGRNSGQPCNASSFANSWCQQGWRWNLDYVVDAHGNAMTYHYTKERNRYGRNAQANTPTVYDRGGYLRRIDYGLRSDDVYATAPARVNFGVGERCIPTSSFDCAEDKYTSANAAHWPDAPFDQHCAEGQNCTNKLSPTFWTRKKLDTITTQVHNGTEYTNVDSWKLEHAYPRTGDGTPPDLWLESITHTGHVGGSAALPALEFGGTQYENRVDTQDDGFAPMLKWRISKILTESGGQLDVSYGGGECDPEAFPDPHANGTRCFPVVNTTADGKSEYTDWFHKYVVTQVSEFDLVTDQPENRTTYEYLGEAGWRYQDADGFARDKHRTWSNWRGYEQVRVVTGTDDATRSATEHRFFRGMHGDHLPNGTRTVDVSDSEGGRHRDLNEYNGFTLEETTLNGPDGDVVEKTISQPWSQVTGERTYSWGTLQARMTGMATSTQYTATGDGWMRTRESAEYDSLGRISQVDTDGDLDASGDEECTRYTYADNPGLRILDSVARTEKVAVDCDTAPSYPEDVISDERSLFDGGGFGEAPTVGLTTSSQRVMEYEGSTPTYQVVEEREYDSYGRTVSETDPRGNVTETSYTSTVTGGVATTVATTNPLGHTETEHLEPARGMPVAEVDANNHRTDMTYDPLGRLTQVWTPDHRKANGVDPAMRFEYHMRNDAPTVVVSRTRRENGSYTSTYQIYDGLLRERQQQEPGVGGGRLITDTFYDSRGLETKKRHAYFNNDAPGEDIFLPTGNDDLIPRYTRTSYDGAERPVEVRTMSMGHELWHTSSQDLGDRQLITPAPGAIPTTTIKNSRGQTVEVRQHEGDTPEADYTSLHYTYTPAGEVETVTDEAGNVWRNHYDLRGRKTRTDEPDRGTTEFVYDSADQVVARTDARDESIVYVYDELGRKVAQHEGGADGPLLASWTFDTVAKGQLSRATRYQDGLEFTTSIAAYDPLGRATSTRIHIPEDPAYGNLSGPYQFRSTYNSDGTVRSNYYAAAGGLPEETVSYTYNDQGLATRVRGMSAAETVDYVHATSYSNHGQILQREHYRNDGSHQAKYIWSTRTYDSGTQRLATARVHAEIGNGTLVQQHYSYDAAGNVLSVRDEPTAEGLLPDVQCFGYDEMRRLTDEWTVAASGDQACGTPPSTDALGGAAPYWNSYTYDDLGNRLTDTRHGLVEGSDVERTYQRPEAGQDRPHAVTQVDSTGAGGTATYAYDEAGNMVSRQTSTRSQTLEWDAEGQLAAVQEGQNTSEFVYDTEGERLIRDDGQKVTLFLPGTELTFDKEELAFQSTRFYEHADEVIASRSNNGSVHWIFSDHHQTGQLAVDSLTGEGVRRRFTAFGGERGNANGAWPNSRGFVGGVVDDQAGLTRLGARSYDSGLGSFISPDPVVDTADSQQMHGYSYSNNNPVSFTDPDGLFLRKSFAKARQWAAQRARQAAIRAYQVRMAAIRAYQIRQAAIRAAQIRAAQIRAAKIRAAQIRAAKAAAAARKAAAMRAAAARKAAAVRAARERAARAAAEKRREAARRQAEQRKIAEVNRRKQEERHNSENFPEPALRGEGDREVSRRPEESTSTGGFDFVECVGVTGSLVGIGGGVGGALGIGAGAVAGTMGIATGPGVVLTVPAGIGLGAAIGTGAGALAGFTVGAGYCMTMNYR
ncbi:RHS repeat-associated core domain-containing protein [Nocardiopsis sp. CA-288880]|uniref:RHS repeat domain-containing protein n=1 Tax=Nocardiopsis sp. CA-288880 TaxID=3239995 RepID=UPI003D996EF4